ncbi:MAG: hypothetical protein HOL98_14155 [Gammaproteobacteria bacterium]|jgi:hypothetical protein|nr:hypothetical protein [Gammaproteobacteria bacterium]MBT5204597.1 hypothetical protein [Gammaproteobacteria bacterium]MBT5602102.1 hypothetical protein [Gammaproteobacteria bacterium]MBT6245012.1 hypothetical protein [Gammaproteobacteria bacterium]
MNKRFILLLLPLLPLLWGVGPWDRLPGGILNGRSVSSPVNDWSFVSEAGYCEVETRPEYPHSVTVNCWHVEGQLYIGCMNCDGKVWSGYLSRGDIARVRIGERIFPVSMQRVIDDEEIARAWLARWEKMGRAEPAPQWPEHYWLYQVNSR